MFPSFHAIRLFKLSTRLHGIPCYIVTCRLHKLISTRSVHLVDMIILQNYQMRYLAKWNDVLEMLHTFEIVPIFLLLSLRRRIGNALHFLFFHVVKHCAKWEESNIFFSHALWLIVILFEHLRFVKKTLIHTLVPGVVQWLVCITMIIFVFIINCCLKTAIFTEF